MNLLNLPPTLPTLGPFQRTFDRDRTVAPAVNLAIQYPDIGYIQRNSDLGVNLFTLPVSCRSLSFLISWQSLHHHNMWGSSRQLSKNRSSTCPRSPCTAMMTRSCRSAPRPCSRPSLSRAPP